MHDEGIHKLIDKLLDGQASAEEAKTVDTWYQSFENAPGITSTLQEAELEKAMDKSFTAVLARLKKG